PGAALPATTSPALPRTSTRTIEFPLSAATALTAAFALFLLYRLIRLALIWHRTTQIRNDGRSPVVPTPLDIVWKRCLDAFQLHDVELLASSGLPSPVTMGEFRKTIVLPDSVVAESSEEVLTTAIGHEMAHLSRHDFALNLIYEIFSLPISFHPA